MFCRINTKEKGSHFGSSWRQALQILHAQQLWFMPFEVTCPAWDLYFVLLVLRKTPGGQRIYAKESVRRNIMNCVLSCRFLDLQTAVLASIAAKRNEVRLVRPVTLPIRMQCEGKTAQCYIPKNEHVRLSSLVGQMRCLDYAVWGTLSGLHFQDYTFIISI